MQKKLQLSQKPFKRRRARVLDLPPPCDFTRLQLGSEQWNGAESFIRETFAECYQATVHEVPATLVALHNSHGQTTAVSGLRYGANERFFLEQYLDLPVESYLGTGNSVDRSRIVEISNLTAPTPGHVRYMMIALTTYLHSAGYEWVVFTAIGSLCNSLVRMHLSPIIFGAADPARLENAAEDWGSYYDMSPQVMAGHLGDANSTITSKTSRPDSPAHLLWRSAFRLGLQDQIAKPVRLAVVEQKPKYGVVGA